ncbi:TPA: H-NS histone family protein [Escherichia coli]|nr:H-NS histone family protein [Escherichia coli]HCN8677759.1 H-NS histone family protein [Escherichia coli]HCN9399822.1 H-NS histone family protein [Escherichia coli]HCO0031472.1 H-NS histone family protein [Escherichia coli]HCO0509069.1 H-NS histone family protein [Escherichia coli]
MSEALQVLNNIRTFRVKVRETDLATLEEMVEKLSVIIEERREEENAARREQEKHQAKLDAFRQRMLEDGIDPAELLSLTSPLAKATIKSRRAPRPAKYKYTDENGNEQTWTGQGRTPKTILEEGKSLEDFAI